MHPSGELSVELELQRCVALLEIAADVSRHREPNDLFRDLSPRLRPVVPFDFINFALFDPEPKTMKMYVWDGGEWPRSPFEVAAQESAVGWVHQNQQVLSIEDLHAENRFSAGLRWLRQHELRSYCVLPMTTVHGKLGALAFGNRQPRAFRAPDIGFLQRVAEMVALCVDLTLAQSVLLAEGDRLRLRIEVDALRAREPNPHQAVLAVLKLLEKLPAHDYVGLYLFDEEVQALRLQMSDAQVAENLAPQALTPLEGSLAGQSFRTRQLVTMEHSALTTHALDSVRRGLALGVKSLCLVPLVSGERSVGVLKVASRKDAVFSSRDIALLQDVAAALTPILQNAPVREGLQPPEKPARELSPFGKLLAMSDAVGPGGWLKKLASHRDSPVRELGEPAVFTPDFSEAEQLLSSYFSSSTVGFCVLDQDLRCMAINNALAAMNGIAPEAHLGKTVREILGDAAHNLEPLFKRVLATGQPILDFEVSTILPTRTELRHWVQHYFPIKNAAGDVTQIGVVVMDITEQKKLEASLRGLSAKLQRETQRLQVLLETSRLLAANWDVKNIFPRVSACLRRVLHQEYGSLLLLGDESGALLRAAIDFPLGKGLTESAAAWPANSPARTVLASGRPLILSRDEMRAFHVEILNQLLSEGLRSLCLAPLIRPKRSLGVLVLGSTRDRAFTTDDLPVVTQVAAQLAIALENAQAAQQVEQLTSRLTAEKRYLEGEIRTQQHFEEIIGESPALSYVLEQVRIVAESNATVLILGETGTGKELIARAIHRASARKDQSFVKLNCAAIPTGLLESELFGHEKGAFTGAVSHKIGRMELADRGTFFLDEVGDIPLELQPKLLRVLQDHEFERLGGTRTIRVDLRLVAATNRDLAQLVARREFRSDLFYRLDVFPIHVPSLRERQEDIPLLVRYFVHKFSRALDRYIESIPTEAMQALLSWHWPGNVRELENIIERSVIVSEGPALRIPMIELQAAPLAPHSPEERTLQNAEREHIIRVLRETGGVVSGPTGAARRLGLKRTTLQSKMQRLHITRKDYSDQTGS